MKRICFLLYLCIHVMIFAFGQDVLDKKTYGINIGESMTFRDGNIYNSSVPTDIARYKYENSYDMSFLTVAKDMSMKKYLLLYSENILILYEQQRKSPAIFGVYPFSLSEGLIFADDKDIVASSELKEGNITYYAKNLGNLCIDMPWVEGVNGNGIGETLQFSVNASGMYIMIGYISFDKPYLWKQNSRPQKVRISFSDTDDVIDTELKDIPHPQYVHFNRFHQDAIITIKIMSVYKGTKYEDTCIHAVIFKAP